MKDCLLLLLLVVLLLLIRRVNYSSFLLFFGEKSEDKIVLAAAGTGFLRPGFAGDKRALKGTAKRRTDVLNAYGLMKIKSSSPLSVFPHSLSRSLSAGRQSSTMYSTSTIPRYLVLVLLVPVLHRR